jgi:hypothetical protein
MGFLFAKVLETKTDKNYVEMCTETGENQSGVSKADFAAAVKQADTVVTWGYGKARGFLDLKDLFCSRHPFCVSLSAFGPFSSAHQAEQLRELVQSIKSNGRARWRTRAGAVRYWFDGAFYEL